MEDSIASKPQAGKPVAFISSMSKPLIFCTAFAAGLFIASITLNLAMYFSISHKYEHLASTFLDHTPQNHSRSFRSSATVTPPNKGSAAAGDIYDNIVLVQVRFATFNRLMPWQTIRATFQKGLEMASEAQASGLILERGLILTSAYVATDTHMLTIQRQGESKEYEAKVVVVAQDLDVALLKVDDPAFWHRNDVAVSLEVEPHIIGRGHKVIVAGFPIGGDFSISKLSSRVARVETDHSGFGSRYSSFPRVGLSLYPKVGNDITVGPVFREKDNALVGFNGPADKVVPIQTLASFIKGYKKDHEWAGLGMLGLIAKPMLSAAMRMYWDLPSEDVGIQVRSVDPLSQLRNEALGENKVEKGDILMAVDGTPIHANGAVIHRNTIDNFGMINNVALPFHVVLAEKSIGDKVRLSFRRSVEQEENELGQKGYKHSRAFDITVTMNRSKPLTERTLDAKAMEPPTYFIVGGLVWTVLSESLVQQATKLKSISIPEATVAAAMHRWRERKNEEVVVLLRALEHPCNKWYSLNEVRIVKYVNGKTPTNMKQFVAEVGKILSKGETLSFTFDALDDEDSAGSATDPDVVLDTGLCAGADKALLAMHQIPTPASMNLKEEYSSLPDSFTQFKFPNKAPTGLTPMKAKAQGKQKAWSTHTHPAPNSTVQEKLSEADQSLKQLPWTNVVQIRLVAAEPDFLSPWKTKPPTKSRCSAIIVDKAKRLILTNSHCVSNAVSLDVLREDAPIPVPARVLEIARDIDLAMITTDDDSFWASKHIRESVSMEENLPYISHAVRVVGYPTGGSSVTITQGIVSRIDGTIYPNGLMRSARNAPDNLLIVQVDAAVNPGNSGGPVFDSYGNLVGLAFAVLASAQSVGYVIPNVHLRNFMFSVSSDSTGHRWKAQPEVGAKFRRIENRGIRNFLSLKNNETGIQVRTVSPYSPLTQHGIVKGDVLLRIDGRNVQGDGKVTRDINGRKITLPFNTKVTEKRLGEKTKLEFLHYDSATGKRTEKVVEDVFGPIPPLVPRFYDAPMPVKGREHFSAQPTYFILWGLVWGVFSNPVLQDALQRKVDVPWSVRKLALHRWLQKDNPGEDVVVLLQGLGHPCTLYYDTSTMRILDYFNGRKVRSMRDLVSHALESDIAKEEYMRITFSPLADKDAAGSSKDPDIVLRRQWCDTADAEVMQMYNIERLASPDIGEYYQEVKAELQKSTKQAEKDVVASFMQVSTQQTDRRSSFQPVQSSSDIDPFGLISKDPDVVNAVDDGLDFVMPLDVDTAREVDVQLHDHAQANSQMGEKTTDHVAHLMSLDHEHYDFERTMQSTMVS